MNNEAIGGSYTITILTGFGSYNKIGDARSFFRGRSSKSNSVLFFVYIGGSDTAIRTDVSLNFAIVAVNCLFNVNLHLFAPSDLKLCKARVLRTLTLSKVVGPAV